MADTTKNAAHDVHAAMAADPQSKKRDPSLLGIIEFAETMATSLHSFYEALDSALYEDFRNIAKDISNMRVEIGKLQAHDLSTRRLPAVDDELDAILAEATSATNTIMENAEALLDAEPTDLASYSADVNDRMIKVIEACSFHDLTGQRVSRVLETMRHIEDRVNRFADAIGIDDKYVPLTAEEAAREKRRAELLLHGPQNGDDAIKQDEVDALFSES